MAEVVLIRFHYCKITFNPSAPESFLYCALWKEVIIYIPSYTLEVGSYSALPWEHTIYLNYLEFCRGSLFHVCLPFSTYLFIQTFSVMKDSWYLFYILGYNPIFDCCLWYSFDIASSLCFFNFLNNFYHFLIFWYYMMLKAHFTHFLINS
jgi:hypothetical protein